MRLIDADVLINRVVFHTDWSTDEKEAFEDEVNAEPTVDAVKVIRCRDCRYSVDEYHDGDCYCRRPSRAYVPEWIGDWDFYCKEAERRQDDKR